MFKEFFLFEIRYRIRQYLPYIFFIIVFLLAFGVVTSTQIQVGEYLGNINVNAPYAIFSLNTNMFIIGVLLITGIMSASATRDFDSNFYQILFTKPISKAGYLFGRFSGGAVIALFSLMGTYLAFLIGPFMPWIEPERIGPFMGTAYLYSFLLIVIPNTIFTGAIIFALSVFTRSSLYAFIGAILLLVAYGFAANFTADLDNETIGILTDPFGAVSLRIVTKYWTIADKNTLVLPISPLLILNRLIWIGVGLAIMGFTYYRFAFSTVKTRKRKKKILEEDTHVTGAFEVLTQLPRVSVSHTTRLHWLQFINQAKLEFFGIIKSIPFLVIMLFGTLNLIGSSTSAKEWFGLTSFPVTYKMINIINGSYLMFLIVIIVYYSGVLVWKERDAKIAELYDASPYPSWVPFYAKLFALVGMLAVLMGVAIIVCVVAQAAFGYTNFELDVYFKDLFLIQFPFFVLFSVLAMFIQTLVNNKYLSYLVLVVYFVLAAFAFPAWNWEHNLYNYASVPSYVYSDMNGFGPFVKGIFWFNAYWFFFAAILCMVATLLWVRGNITDFRNRLHVAQQNLTPAIKRSLLLFGILWIATGSYIYYNTNILNDYVPGDMREELAVEYEKTYKKYQRLPQPKVTDVKFDIDIYPYERKLYVKGQYLLKNKTPEPIDSVHVILNNFMDAYDISLENAQLAYNDEKLLYQIYALDPPLQPGDSMKAEYTASYEIRGFENELTHREITHNGTFFNNGDISPRIGYDAGRELSDRQQRREYDLPERERMPNIDDTLARMTQYVDTDADWVTFEATVSTSPDQMAVAPGSLMKEWEENGRKYFHYKLFKPVLNFYSFISARYEVERDTWTNPAGEQVDVEIYYHPGHEYNVPRMVNSIKNSLTYYSQNFSPYPHQQARIIEFPRYASFAQAFPGTMPYSEAIGFIADIDDEDKDLDMVYYVVAHEMAHQWWAHQVIGGYVKGATLMSESMSQYSALMVMEEAYGREQMEKFLKYEMNNYLRGRGGERLKEFPIIFNENQQYIHYNKGSIVTYALQDYIGEATMNAALARYVDSVAYQEPPFTYSLEFLGFLEEATPDSLRYLLKDMFEEITLYDNRTTDASYKSLDNGKYLVTLNVESTKLKADTLGAETTVPVNDWMDIGVYQEVEENGRKKEKLMYIQRKKIDKNQMTFEIEVDAVPVKAGIDPLYLLVDRVPDDNVKKVTESPE